MTGRDSSPAYAGSSDVGRVRTDNEDSLLLSPPLFAVADGLGGHQAGEVASRIAVETLMAQAPRRADAKGLGRAVRSANKAVIDAAVAGRGRAGMGTTLTAAMLDGGRIAVAHVGDSRAYLLHRDGTLERLTQDHSMVADMVRQGSLTEEESRVHPNRSVITRALGSDPNMAPDTFEVTAEPGDRLLLCTDGLSALVPDEELTDVLSRKQDPAEAVGALVAAAQLAGGYDNITAVVVDIAGGDAPTRVPHRERGAGSLLWVLGILALVAVIGMGVFRYASSHAYLVAENGVIVVYRGVPGEVAGVSLHQRDEVTDVRVADLPVQDAIALSRGVSAESLDQARALLVGYRVQAARNAAPPSSPATLPLPPSTSATWTP